MPRHLKDHEIIMVSPHSAPQRSQLRLAMDALIKSGLLRQPHTGQHTYALPLATQTNGKA